MNFYIILSSIVLSIGGLFIILCYLLKFGSNRSSMTDNKISDESELYEL